MDSYTRQWAQHNALKVGKSFEEHPEMAATMAMLDTMGDDGDTASAIAALCTSKLP